MVSFRSAILAEEIDKWLANNKMYKYCISNLNDVMRKPRGKHNTFFALGELESGKTL